MTDEQKREYAEAIKHALGMGYGPPMDGEEGWVPPAAMTVEDADDEDLADELERTAKERAENAQAVIEAIREAKERRMAEELAKQRAKAADPRPSTDPWAVIGKAEDDGERIMDITGRFS